MKKNVNMDHLPSPPPCKGKHIFPNNQLNSTKLHGCLGYRTFNQQKNLSAGKTVKGAPLLGIVSLPMTLKADIPLNPGWFMTGSLHGIRNDPHISGDCIILQIKPTNQAFEDDATLGQSQANMPRPLVGRLRPIETRSHRSKVKPMGRERFAAFDMRCAT